MAIIRYPNISDLMNPFREVERLKREVNRLFGDFMSGGVPSMVSSGVFPALNVNEDSEKYYVEAELPGIKPEDLEVSVEGKTLTLRGERKSDAVENASYHRRERRWGRFQKALTLPLDLNAESVTAEFKDGVLKLVLPKAEKAKPKKIAVKTE